MSRPNIDLIARVLSEILSDKHGVDVSIQFVPNDPEPREAEKAGATA